MPTDCVRNAHRDSGDGVWDDVVLLHSVCGFVWKDGDGVEVPSFIAA